MSNIYNYIDKYGNKTFDEEPFNLIDSAIFACLSYANLDGIVSNKRKKISIEEAAKIYFNKYTKKQIKNNITAVSIAIKLLDKLKDKRRFKDLELYNYIYSFDAEKQFSAMFIDIDSKRTYISFEGTDDLISGWKEDGKLAYEFPVPAHKDAIKYLNVKIPLFSMKKYIIGGHSKGGNLALVSSMYCSSIIKKKIEKIYSFDGPGLKSEQFFSDNYKSIEERFKLVIPNYSVIGLLLNHPEHYRIIESTKKDFFCHAIDTWIVEGNRFVEAPSLSKFSKKIDNLVDDWLAKYTDEDRKEFLEDLFDVMKRANINSLLDIKTSTINSIYRILKESKNISPKSKEMIKEFIGYVLDFIKYMIKLKVPFINE